MVLTKPCFQLVYVCLRTSDLLPIGILMNEGQKRSKNVNHVLHVLLKWHVNFQKPIRIITSILESRIEILGLKLYFTSN
jgi:hypothetical protein